MHPCKKKIDRLRKCTCQLCVSGHRIPCIKASCCGYIIQSEIQIPHHSSEVEVVSANKQTKNCKTFKYLFWLGVYKIVYSQLKIPDTLMDTSKKGTLW